MLPNFIIAGVEKTGSTSLYNYLGQHPDVFLCDPKEPEFFLKENFSHQISSYERLFEEVSGETAIGEASVSYFHNFEAGPRIKDTLPDARIIVILRDPAERAYSHYNMMVEYNAIPNRPFIEALRDARDKDDYYNTGIPTSRYADALEQYLDLFGDNLQVHLYSDYREDPIAVVQSILHHIGVDSTFVPDMSERHNVTYRPRSSFTNQLLWKKSNLKEFAKMVLPVSFLKRVRRKVLKANRASVPPLSSEARGLAIKILESDINRTEYLLKRDLSHWKQ